MTLLASPTTPSASQSTTPALSADDLPGLMQEVQQTALRLQQTHDVLHREVARLQRELSDANEQLRRSASLAALGEMAAGIAHEIRNPLASIQLYVQMLEEDLAERPDQAAVCTKIGSAITGLDGIVRDVLRFARDDRMRVARHSAARIVDNAVRAADGLLGQTKMNIDVVDVDPAIIIDADEGLLTQAIVNVIRNAAEAMADETPAATTPPTPATGAIRISAEVRGVREPGKNAGRVTRAVISVEDCGPGIPDDVIERMFNPFFTTRATGTGLGLAIVHRIVDAHGGHVSVRSVDPHGARVEMCLPLATADEDSHKEVAA